MVLRLMAVAATMSVFAASASVPREPYYVHQHSVAHKREAAWARTLCGSYTTNPPTSDQITSWGAAVTPVGVLQGEMALPF